MNNNRIRVRGAPRKDIDLHLLAQALLMISEDLAPAQQDQSKDWTKETKTTTEDEHHP